MFNARPAVCMPGEHVVAVHQLLPRRGGADVAPRGLHLPHDLQVAPVPRVLERQLLQQVRHAGRLRQLVDQPRRCEHPHEYRGT